MPKLNYPLKAYIKAVELMAEKKGVVVNVVPNKGSVVRFELFEKNNKVPMCMWVIHHSHKGNKKEIWSRDDYKKAALNLNCSVEEFLNNIR